jgi:hypothetical protein
MADHVALTSPLAPKIGPKLHANIVLQLKAAAVTGAEALSNAVHWISRQSAQTSHVR